MDAYKEASRQKMRFTTSRGSLSVEQLWELSLDELDQLAVSLEEQHKESGKKSFLVKKSVKDRKLKTMFEVVHDVLSTKVDEAEAAAEAKEIKAHNEKILTIIAEKKDEALKGKSVKQLMAELK